MNAELTLISPGVHGLPVVSEIGKIPITDASGVQHPRTIWDIWGDAELVAIGYARIDDSPIPLGKISTGHSDAFTSNRVVRTHTLANAPSEPPEDKEAIYNGHMAMGHLRLFKAFLLALNDGSIVPGANATAAQLKAAIKAKM
tara:strand:- start:6780 stop:7208 length:429 start_codon:yes stop_codon:yes gene_type:complete